MEFTGIVLIVCSLVLMLYFLLHKEGREDTDGKPDSDNGNDKEE